MNRPLDLREAGRITADMLFERWVPSTRPQLEAALNHHDRVLDDLAALLRAGAGLIRTREHAVTVQEVASNPAGALLGALTSHPRAGKTQVLAPSDLLTQRDSAAGAWRDLNRVLLLEAHRWERMVQRAPAPVQWGLVADVAAIARAVVVLQQDLAEAAKAQGLFAPVQRTLRTSAGQVLTVTADETLRMARRGPTRDGWTGPTPLLPAQFVPVTDRSDIVPAARSLAQALHHPGLRLDATSALELLSHHAMTTETASRFLGAHGHRDTAAALHQHAEHLLAGARAANNRVWSANAHPHERPLHQGRQLNWALQREVRSTSSTSDRPTAAIDLVNAYAATVPAITAGLTARITTALETGAWAVIDTDSDRPSLTWRPARSDDLSTLRKGLAAARHSVRDLGPADTTFDTSVENHPHAAHRTISRALVSTRPPPPARPHRPTVLSARSRVPPPKPPPAAPTARPPGPAR